LRIAVQAEGGSRQATGCSPTVVARHDDGLHLRQCHILQPVHQAGMADQKLRAGVADHVRQQVAAERGVDRAVPGARELLANQTSNMVLPLGSQTPTEYTLVDTELAQRLCGGQHLGPGLRPGPLCAIFEYCKTRSGVVAAQWSRSGPSTDRSRDGVAGLNHGGLKSPSMYMADSWW